SCLARGELCFPPCRGKGPPCYRPDRLRPDACGKHLPSSQLPLIYTRWESSADPKRGDRRVRRVTGQWRAERPTPCRRQEGNTGARAAEHKASVPLSNERTVSRAAVASFLKPSSPGTCVDPLEHREPLSGSHSRVARVSRTINLAWF